MSDRRSREREAERARDALDSIRDRIEDNLEEAEAEVSRLKDDKESLLEALETITGLDEHDFTGFGNLGEARRIASAAIKKYC